MAQAQSRSSINSSLRWLVTVSIINLLGNTLGTVVALQQNLTADWGGSLNGQNVLQDFVGLKGTALSAPLSFLLIQLVFTWLVTRPGRARTIGVVGLALVGLVYTLGQAGEPITLRQLQLGGFDLLQSLILLVNLISAAAMLVLSVRMLWAKRSARLIRA